MFENSAIKTAIKSTLMAADGDIDKQASQCMLCIAYVIEALELAPQNSRATKKLLQEIVVVLREEAGE